MARCRSLSWRSCATASMICELVAVPPARLMASKVGQAMAAWEGSRSASCMESCSHSWCDGRPRSVARTWVSVRHPNALSKEPQVVTGYQPWASSPAVRRTMQGNRKRDTRPEVALRRVLHARGVRYRVAAKPLVDRPWTADVVFRGLRLAVFVDGCYWHGCPQHYALPRTNATYWGEKIARNQARDAQVDVDLKAAGWTSLRIWEHESVEIAADRVLATLIFLRAER
jgi:DNA mismatch endonuclease, patch repair protein